MKKWLWIIILLLVCIIVIGQTKAIQKALMYADSWQYKFVNGQFMIVSSYTDSILGSWSEYNYANDSLYGTNRYIVPNDVQSSQMMRYNMNQYLQYNRPDIYVPNTYLPTTIPTVSEQTYIITVKPLNTLFP